MRTRQRPRPVLPTRWGMRALALLSICVGGFLLLPKLNLEDIVRNSINHEIGRIFGEDVKLRSDAKVSIRPDFRVVVANPIFTSADAGGSEGYLTASRIEASLSIMPMLLGRGEVANLHLYGPHISMDNIPAPVALWSEMPGADQTHAEGPKSPTTIGITDGTLQFAGGTSISGLNLSILPRTASGDILVSGDFITGSRRTFVELQLDDSRRFFETGQSAGTLSFRIDKGDTLDESDPSGTPPESSILADLRRISDSVNLFGPEPLRVDGHFAVTPDAIRVSNATFSKSGVELQGDLDLRTTAEASIVPKLQTTQVSADTAISDAIRKIRSGDWAAIPINTSWLKGLEIDFDLEGQEIALGGAAFEAVTISLRTRDNDLSLDVAAQSDTLGRFEARTAITPSTDVTVWASVSDASVNAILQPITRRMQTRLIGTRQLPEGALNGALKLAGRGKTLGAILETLSGSLTASMEDGSLTGADVTATLETLAKGRQFMTKEKGPLIPAAGRTQFDLIDGQVGIEAGTARISRLYIAGERLEINMLGEVGLRNGAMYIKGNAQLSAAQETEAKQVARHVDLPFGIGGTVFSPMVAAGVPQFEVATTTLPSGRSGHTLQK